MGYRDAQAVIEDQIELLGLAKNVHWNATGRGFIEVHKYLDEVFLDAVSFVDEIAEHMVSTGTGLPAWQGQQTMWPVIAIGGGTTNVRDGVREIVVMLDSISDLLDETLLELDDFVLSDIYTRLLQRTNQHLWFLRNEL